MTKGPPLRFDIDVLRELAGDKVFARGLAYHRAGQVTILAIEPARAVARVSGSKDYRAVLTGTGTRIGGECSCPAFEDFGFCKHLVATALTVNDADPATGEGALERIRTHLRGKDTESLVALIVDLAERDDLLFRRLEMEAATTADDDKTVLSRLRKAVTDTTRTGGFVHYREAAAWAESVEAVLDHIAGLVPAGRAALALRLIYHAMARIEKAVGEIDDSDGHCTFLLNRARDIHLEATPDTTMPELPAKLRADRGVPAHPASLSRALLAAGFSFKKTLLASECEGADLHDERQIRRRTGPVSISPRLWHRCKPRCLH